MTSSFVPSMTISLKDLIFKEDKELTLWYQQYRHNLLDLLANVDIDKVNNASAFRLLISDEYDKFYPLFSSITPKFTHKNTGGK